MRFFYFLIVFISVGSIAFSQSAYNLSADFSFMDKGKYLIISNKIPEGYISENDVVFTFKDEQYKLQNPPTVLQYGTAYKLKKNNFTYTLYFSELPLLNIYSYKKIVTESDELVPGKIEMSDNEGFKYQSFIGIKVRGNSSRTFPKKSYQIRIWTDSASAESKEKAFWGMRKDDKWLLLAMWNENTRLNNMFSHNLWLNIHKLYYAEKEPDANSAVRMKYVEMFLDGVYKGVYAFSEGMDRKELKLKKKQDDGTIRGELYKGDQWGKGLVTFNMDKIPAYDNNKLFWDGYEMKYPDDLPVNWSMLSNFAYFVGKGSNAEFKSHIFEQFKKENAMDYFIFLNLLHAGDNTGKNIYLAKYKEGEPYFYAPWDLDGVLGYDWTGSQIGYSNDILYNNLYKRLMELNVDNYNKDISVRWFSLREAVLKKETLMDRLDSLSNFLTTSGVYKRENIAWPANKINPTEINYTKDWLNNRIDVLDTFFYYQKDAISIEEQEESLAKNIKIGITHNEFIVFFDKTIGYSRLEYQMNSFSGKWITSGSVNPAQNKIDVSFLPSGIYFLRFKDDLKGIYFTKKVVKY